MQNDRDKIIISPNWFRLIAWVSDNVPNGEIRVKIVQGLPVKLLEHKQDIRFDKEMRLPSVTGNPFNI